MNIMPHGMLRNEETIANLFCTVITQEVPPTSLNSLLITIYNWDIVYLCILVLFPDQLTIYIAYYSYAKQHFQLGNPLPRI